MKKARECKYSVEEVRTGDAAVHMPRWKAVQRRGPHRDGENARRRERVWQWSGRLRWKWRQQRMVGVVCRGLRCSDMRTCARRREGGSGRRGGGSSREVEVVSGGGGGSSRGGVPMAVLQQHVCCVHLCAEEREAAVVGEVEVAVAVAEEVGVVCDWHRQCRGTVGCLTGGSGRGGGGGGGIALTCPPTFALRRAAAVVGRASEEGKRMQVQRGG